MKKVIMAVLTAAVTVTTVSSAFASSWEFDATAQWAESIGIDGTGSKIDIKGFGDEAEEAVKAAKNIAYGADVSSSALNNKQVVFGVEIWTGSDKPRVTVTNTNQTTEADVHKLEINTVDNYYLWQDRQLTVGSSSYGSRQTIGVEGYTGLKEVAVVAAAAALVNDKFNTKNYETRSILLDSRDGNNLNLYRALSPIGDFN